ncbi:MAG: hypothetical protein QW599_06030 [Nitrososphaerota archaeon]
MSVMAEPTDELMLILDTLEHMLGRAESGYGDPLLKKRILSLLSNLEAVLRRLVDTRLIMKATGQVITATLQALDPAFQAISEVRYHVKNNNWEAAHKCLDVIEGERGETLPGLRAAVMRAEAALMLAAQGFKETSQTYSGSPVTIPEDLQFGAPAIMIPLYNKLVRERRIEKEETKSRILPPNYTPEQESEFEYAWSLLRTKGYASLEVDKKGRQYLVYMGEG